VAPPDEAESDDPWVVPLRGLLVAPEVSGFVASTDPTVDGTVAAAPVPAPDSTDVTMGAAGIAPSGPVTPVAALAVTAVGTGLVAGGFVGTGLLEATSPGLLPATVGAGFVGAGVVGGALEGAVAAEVAGTVMTEETMGVSAWKRSAALTISF
jgi:hypothetical protein